MLGPEGAAERLTAWLTTAIPARLRKLETRYELEPATLPDPALLVDHDTGPLGLEDWPAVLVLPQRLDSLGYVDTVPAGELYRATYALELLEWLRAEDYATTDELRRRYVLATREALLERKQAQAAPAYGEQAAGTFTVDPSSIREDYSPVLTDEARRTLAGVRITVNVVVVELLDGPAPMGNVNNPPAVDETPQGIDEPITNVVVHPGLM